MAEPQNSWGWKGPGEITEAKQSHPGQAAQDTAQSAFKQLQAQKLQTSLGNLVQHLTLPTN